MFCAKSTIFWKEIVDFGYSAVCKKTSKIMLTFFDIKGILSNVAEHGNNKNEKQCWVSRAFFERAETKQKSFSKKLLTNKVTHDNINELLMRDTDKQTKWTLITKQYKTCKFFKEHMQILEIL